MSTRPAPRGTAAYPRKRANRACQVCRARRTKCDNKRPSCSFCEKAGTNCVWAPHDLSSFDPASLAILERFDRLENLILSTSNQSRPQVDASPQNLGISPVSVVQQQERSSNQLKGGVPTSSLDFRIECVLEWQPLQSILADTSFSLPETSPSKDSAYHGLISSLDDLDMITCNRLLDRFWRSVHSKNPILVLEDVKRYMHQVVLDGIAWDAKSSLVLLLCALGTISTDFGSAENNHDIVGSPSNEDLIMAKHQAQLYFSAAQKRLTACLGKRGVLESQCFFYSGVYLATILQPEAAWSMFLQAKASCQSFGWLTQAVPEAANFGDALERNESWVAEQCTYWTCLKSEIEFHLELNPPGFRMVDLWYPEKFPDPPRHTIEDSHQSWFFYLAEIALRRLANRIHAFNAEDHDMDKPQDLQSAHESAFEFEQEANDWVQSLPGSSELTNYDDDVLSFILKGHLTNCYEFIYWPFVKQAIKGPFRNFSNDEYVRKGLSIAFERLNVNRPGFKHRHHGTYLMIRSCTRSAFVLLAAHFKGGLEDLMPMGWFDSVGTVVELLEYWEDELAPARHWRAMMMHLMQKSQFTTL